MTRAILMLAFSLPLAAPGTYDIVVYGGTPGGIAAIASARLGHSVALIEYLRPRDSMTLAAESVKL